MTMTEYELHKLSERLAKLEADLDQWKLWATEYVERANATYAKRDEYIRDRIGTIFEELETTLRDYRTAPRLTIKEDVAIRLQVPASGTEWIDHMIREAIGHRIAKRRD